ncbi:hypothetical protein HanPSC8_Chr14g0598771 [Helianthus annuus]|nr:hypothetical protein HanPSC8_Chr14g0598771 [Helianthus annuus]
MLRTNVIFRSMLSFGQHYHGSVKAILRSTLLWFEGHVSFGLNYVSTNKYLSVTTVFRVTTILRQVTVTFTQSFQVYPIIN